MGIYLLVESAIFRSVALRSYCGHGLRPIHGRTFGTFEVVVLRVTERWPSNALFDIDFFQAPLLDHPFSITRSRSPVLDHPVTELRTSRGRWVAGDVLWWIPPQKVSVPAPTGRA
jgi:hypothetical protein